MTSNLDGETNLKPRVVSPDLRAATAAAAAASGGGDGDLAGAGGVLALAAHKAVVECDLPNQKLEHFDGAVAVSPPLTPAPQWVSFLYYCFHGTLMFGGALFAPTRGGFWLVAVNLRMGVESVSCTLCMIVSAADNILGAGRG